MRARGPLLLLDAALTDLQLASSITAEEKSPRAIAVRETGERGGEGRGDLYVPPLVDVRLLRAEARQKGTPDPFRPDGDNML